MDRKEAWRAGVLKKYGTWEAFQEAMREASNKSKRNLGGKGGFASLTPEQHRAVSAKGGKNGSRSNTKRSSDSPMGREAV